LDLTFKKGILGEGVIPKGLKGNF